MILDNCVDVCKDIELLNILSIFKTLISLVTIIVPVILVIFVIIDIIKTVSSGEVDTKKLWNSISKRIIAAVIVFLIFPILNTILRILPFSNLYYIECYNCADKDNILQITKTNAETELNKLASLIYKLDNDLTEENYNNAILLFEQARQAIKKVTDKNFKKTYQSELDRYKDKLEEIRKLLNGNATNSSENHNNSENQKNINLFIGDSRMITLCNYNSLCHVSNDGSTCYSDKCLAKVGAGISWYKNTALGKINNIIDADKKYNIIINLGVNDINKDGTRVARSYFYNISSYAKNQWKNHNIIIVSVNPVIDGKSNAYNSGIISFNKTIKESIENSNLPNIKYCDTYNNLEISPTADGLHYDNITSNNIYNYILNKCL